MRRLTFIRRCRDFGFSVDRVRALVGLLDDPHRDCTEARDIGQAHLDAVRARLAELKALERMLTGFVQRCATLCAGGPGPDCVPLAQLTAVAPPKAAVRRPAAAAAPRSRRSPDASASGPAVGAALCLLGAAVILGAHVGVRAR